MAGGSEEGLVCGSPPGCAGSGGGRAAGAPAAGGLAGGADPDGNGGGAVLTGWTASCSSESGAGSGGDPARRGDGGSVSKRTLSVANSAGAIVMGRGGGPAAGRVVSGLAILRSELPAAWATGGTGAAGTGGGAAPLVARATRGAGPPRTGSGVLGDGGAVVAGVWMGTSSGLGRLRKSPLFLLMRRSARRATFKSAITSRSDIGSP